MSTAAAKTTSNRRLVARLAVTVVAMFGFGYALVPLYDILCEVTGLTGKTGVVEASDLDGVVDTSRLVTVQFVANVNSTLPWEVRPVEKTLRVHPGKVYETRFFAKNLTDETLVGQATPSVSPGTASRYFNKTECFCFTRQSFAPGEGRDMPVRFVIDRGLSDGVSTVTLAYTFFRVSDDS